MTEAKRVDRILRNIRANMRIENFDFSEQTEVLCATVASGQRDAEEVVRELLRAYSAKQK